MLRGLLLDDDAEGGAVMEFGGFDEDAFLALRSWNLWFELKEYQIAS